MKRTVLMGLAAAVALTMAKPAHAHMEGDCAMMLTEMEGPLRQVKQHLDSVMERYESSGKGEMVTEVMHALRASFVAHLRVAEAINCNEPGLIPEEMFQGLREAAGE